MRSTLKRSTSRVQARLFFAVYPDDEVREQLVRVQADFAAHTARAVIPDNLHLTLAFLGNVPPERRECYAQAAGAVDVQPFCVTLDRFGYLGKRSSCCLEPSVISMELRGLYKQLQSAIAPCGYRSRREFHPHVTLFRKAAGLAAPERAPAVEWVVDRFFLVESVQQDDGVVYLPIEEFA